MTKKYTNKSKLLGKVGTENYRVSDCPVYLPKENVKFFMAMQNAGNKDPFSSDTWGNQITPGWKKTIYEAISRGVKNALNESFDFNEIFEGECCGECGGIGGAYNTPTNTVGVGNVVPAQGTAMTGAQQASDMFNGSGDLTIPKSQKKSKKKKSKNSGVTYFPLAIKKGV